MTAVYRQTDNSSWLVWSEGRQPLGAVLQSTDELRELHVLQLLYHNDSIINMSRVLVYIQQPILHQ